MILASDNDAAQRALGRFVVDGHVEPTWPPQLFEVQPPDEEGELSRTNGYAETVAQLRDAAGRVGRPSELDAKTTCRAKTPHR